MILSKYETALIEYGDFLVAGLSINATEDSDFSAVWRELYEGLSSEQVQAVKHLQAVGVMMPDAADTGFTYTAGFMVPGGIKDVATLGLTGVVVPAALYATVLVQGPVPEGIKPGFDYLYSEFVSGRSLSPTGVNLEVYGPGDPAAADYRMYCWVAVSRAPQA